VSDHDYEAVARAVNVTVGTELPAGRFTTRVVDLSAMRPTRYLWRPWLPHGRLNLMVGREKIGKSSLQAHLAARVTLGELPGQYFGRPADVLWVSADEDDWHEVVTPRLFALGADVDRVRELVPVNDSDVFNVVDHVAELDRALRERHYGLVVFEQLIDALPHLKAPNDPSEIRGALRPLRRVLAAREVTALGTLHVNKARVTELRQHVQGSIQYLAIARATILVAAHPTDEERRVAVLGPANYVASTPSLAFDIEEVAFEHNDAQFRLGRVANLDEDPNVTLDDVLAVPASRERERPRDQHSDDMLEALSAEPQTTRALAGVVGLSTTTAYRLLSDLEDEGMAEQTGRGWVCSTFHTPIGEEHETGNGAGA
jgi:hypothetical protein